MIFALQTILNNKGCGAVGKRAIALAVLVSAGFLAPLANVNIQFAIGLNRQDRQLPALLTTNWADSRIQQPSPAAWFASAPMPDASSAAYAVASSLPPGVTTKNPVKYRVRMRTKVVAFLPKTGKMELEDDRLSSHVLFEENAAFKPGQIRYYQSEFELFSCDRSFDRGSRAVTWRMFTGKDFAGLEPPRTVNPEISAVADRLKNAYGPVDFVIESCKWIRENIKYDAAAPYVADDANSIMQNKRGHCGHQQTIFKQLCARAGVPYKGMLGLDLYAANGVGELSSIRGDYTNAHTWSQVFFPGIGWVEVDTVEGANCFKIDGRFVQNNTAFENYAVWVTEGDETREVEWSSDHGRFVCDYGVENLITFSQSAAAPPRTSQAPSSTQPAKLLPEEEKLRISSDLIRGIKRPGFDILHINSARDTGTIPGI